MIKLSGPSKFILLITAGIFISEVVVMGIIATMDSLPYLQLSVIDATLMILLATPLLYFFSLRPLLKVIAEREAEIAQRRQTEAQLRIQTKALETAANGVIVTNKDGKIIWANQAFAQMTGYSVAEVLGKSPNFLNSGVHDADFYKRLWETITSGTVWHGEITNRRKDGTHYIDEQTITPVFNSSGEIENFIAIQQDVTERKHAENALLESEEKFRALADWTYDWEVWLDPQGDIVYMSPSCERISGFHPEEFVANSNLLLEIIHPDDKQFYQEHQRALHNEAMGPLTVEYRIIARDGSEHWIEHICRPLLGKDSRYLGRRISNRDITERKRAEKDIKEREENQHLLTQTIHTMQIDIARDLHDTVGQNISFLRMKLDHMVETGPLANPDVALDLKRMNEVANESYDMIRGTLAVLQLEDTNDLSHLFARYAAQIEERSSFAIDFASHGNPRPVSPSQMRQLFYVFREVLSNIEKHANASQVSLDLTWEEKYMTLVIFDNGRGFDSTNSQYDGHYGLQFIRDRLDSLNGSISIYSAVGSGADIIIHVPYE